MVHSFISSCYISKIFCQLLKQGKIGKDMPFGFKTLILLERIMAFSEDPNTVLKPENLVLEEFIRELEFKSVFTLLLLVMDFNFLY